MKKHILIGSLLSLVLGSRLMAAAPHVVLMTDFGVMDGAVCEVKGVIAGVDSDLRVDDLTHAIEPFNIWEASYRLNQVVRYWPDGTVFVSVVDPGVGTERNSVVVELEDPSTGRHFLVVTPNNGTLSHVSESMTIKRIREINEEKNRLPTGSMFHTFHGRDLFGYTGARLAKKQISIEDVGRALETKDLIMLTYDRPAVSKDVLTGIIPTLDVNYGNVWSNIPASALKTLELAPGATAEVVVRHMENGEASEVWRGQVPYARTFGSVPQGQPLIYINSLDQVALALNQGDFAEENGIESGPSWKIEIRKASGAPAASPGPSPSASPEAAGK